MAGLNELIGSNPGGIILLHRIFVNDPKKISSTLSKSIFFSLHLSWNNTLNELIFFTFDLLMICFANVQLINRHCFVSYLWFVYLLWSEKAYLKADCNLFSVCSPVLLLSLPFLFSCLKYIMLCGGPFLSCSCIFIFLYEYLFLSSMHWLFGMHWYLYWRISQSSFGHVFAAVFHYRRVPC